MASNLDLSTGPFMDVLARIMLPDTYRILLDQRHDHRSLSKSSERQRAREGT